MLSGLEVMRDVMPRAIEALGVDMGVWVDAKAEALAYLQTKARCSGLDVIGECMPQGLKPRSFQAVCGTTEVVPFHKT
jgi:hypothetical protein